MAATSSEKQQPDWKIYGDQLEGCNCRARPVMGSPDSVAYLGDKFTLPATTCPVAHEVSQFIPSKTSYQREG